MKKILPRVKNQSLVIPLVLAFWAILLCLNSSVQAATIFDNDYPDGKMATASRPDSAGKFEIEAADDFVLTQTTSITKASFTGLLSGGTSLASIGQVVVEIYRVFPNDSDVGRTSGPPTFSTSSVPTRVNSPSDVELTDSLGGLSFTTAVLNSSFTAANSILNGINKIPSQTTLGEGPVTGIEVQFDVTFTTPLYLTAGHYFFVPQVELTDANGEFLWLSASKPIVPPGTPFPSGSSDLQSWTRDTSLDSDWLRVGTDIVGGSPAPTYNARFSLSGNVVPLPSALWLISSGLGLLAWRRFR
jgi:hypothetical protein